MIKANKSPVLTSNNFGINFLELSHDVFKTPTPNFKNVEIKNSSIASILKCPKFALQKPISKNIQTQKPNSKFLIEIFKSSQIPIEINFKLEKNEVLCDQILIRTKENVSAKIVLNFFGKQNSSAFSKIRFEGEKNSNTQAIFCFDLCSNFLNFEQDLQENATSKIFVSDFSKENQISNIFCEQQENSQSEFNVFYMSKNVVDQNFLIELIKPNAKTNLNVLGTLNGKAQKAFRGTINFLSGAKKAVGKENEFCLMLSKNAVSKSLPMLLCTEEDMEGSHSSSSGMIDENLLFYLLSRGLDENEAKTLLIKAKISRHLESIFDEKTKKFVIEKIEKELKK